MTETWEEVLQNLKEAEENWARLLREGRTDEKPAILDAGPKPKKLKKKPEKEAVYPVFPLPNTKKSRGGEINRTKKQIRILQQMVTYDTQHKNEILDQINNLKLQIKTKRKISKKLKQKQKKYNE